LMRYFFSFFATKGKVNGKSTSCFFSLWSAWMHCNVSLLIVN
jgi:hypothetical protein